MKQILIERELFAKVETINRVTREISPNWLSNTSKLNDMVLISNYIKGLINKENQQSQWLKGCYKEPYKIWSDIMLLEEAELKPSSLQITDRNIRLMVDIWHHIIKKSKSIETFRAQMHSYDNPEKMKSLLKILFGVDDVSTIVINGMFYITPIQERILRLIEKSGVKLVFLIPYSKKYSKIHRIWEKTYSEQMGYPKMSEWHCYETPVVNPIGDMFEDNPCDISNLTITEYESNLDFVRDIKNSGKRVHLYSPDPDSVKELLEEYYPNEYGNKTLISYPIGRYIYTLHDMWDDEYEELTLDIEKIQQCFASGWVPATGYRSNDYLKDLIYLEPFFKDCITVDDWNDRLSYLWSIHQNIISNFESNSDDEKIKRWENVLGNPFSNFGFFSIETERLKAVKSLIEKLIESAEVLFRKNSRINIADHINKVIRMIDSKDDLSELQKEERTIVESLLKKIGSETYESSFLPSDISNAMKYFLSNTRDFSDSDYDESTVNPLYELCGSQVDSQTIHICFSDLKRLPGTNSNYVWPLTDDCINKTCENVDHDAPIHYLKHLINETPDNNKYWLYEGLFNKKVKISWISNSRGKLMVCSPYISLLSVRYGLPIEQYEKNVTSEDNIERVDKMDNFVSCLMTEESELLVDEKLKISDCPLSYVYGYVLNKSPTYSSEFHLSFVAEKMISSLISVYGDEHKPEIEKNVNSILPYLRKIEKRQIVDHVIVNHYENETIYNNNEYSDKRLDIEFINGIPSLDEDTRIDVVDVLSSSKNNPPGKCMYCPHTGECIVEKRGVDDNEK